MCVAISHSSLCSGLWFSFLCALWFSVFYPAMDFLLPSHGFSGLLKRFPIVKFEEICQVIICPVNYLFSSFIYRFPQHVSYLSNKAFLLACCFAWKCHVSYEQKNMSFCITFPPQLVFSITVCFKFWYSMCNFWRFSLKKVGYLSRLKKFILLRSLYYLLIILFMKLKSVFSKCCG